MKATNLLHYPKAKNLSHYGIKGDRDMTTKGGYFDEYPRGAVIHYTAGPSAKSAYNTAMDYGYTFFIIGKDGGVLQPFPLNRWGSHAGKSKIPYADAETRLPVSSELVGIEVVSMGLLTEKDGEYVSWLGGKIPRKDVRLNDRGEAFEKFTIAQEESLFELITWLKKNNPEVFNYDLVFGHNEVSPGRKIDPSSALSLTMPDYRDYLRTFSGENLV